MADITQQAQQYYYLVQKGTPPAEAFKQAFPNGVPTALDRAKADASAKQKQGYGQIAGALAGLAGTRYLMDKVPGWFATGDAAAKAPEILSASRLGTEAGATVTGGSASGGGMAGGAVAEAPGMFSVNNIGGVGNAILPAVGAVGAYDLIKNDRGPVRGALQGAASGAAIGSAFGGVGAIPGAFIGGGLGLAESLLFDGKSTKDYQKEKWGSIADSGNQVTKNYATNYRDNYLKSDQANIDAQYPNTFEGKKESGTLTAKDVWGGEAFFDTFKDDWLNKYSEDQRQQIAQAAIDNDLLTTSKGMLVAKNPDQLLALGSLPSPSQKPMVQALGGVSNLPASIKPVARPTGSNMASMIGAQKLNPMVQALQNNPNSPGFKNGKRIVY